MTMVKSSLRASRAEREFSSVSRNCVSSDEDELQRRSSDSESDGDDCNEDDADSAVGSDDFDLSELGEIGEESCQVGSQKCSIPFDLYDLPNLSEVLSVDAWNHCLTEEERFSLAKYLPDMDQETFTNTLKELFSGCNFHFGSPLAKIFNMLKGGLCEPRVALYQQGLTFLQKREHYHHLRKYQNSMVGSLIQMKRAWTNCAGYSIEERLRVLNIRRSQRSLMHEKREEIGLETDSSGREESDEGFWSKRLKDVQLGLTKGHRAGHAVNPSLDVSSRRRAVILEPTKYGQKNPKGTLKFAGLNAPSKKEMVASVPSIHHGSGTKSVPYSLKLAFSKKDQAAGYDPEIAHHSRGLIRGKDDVENLLHAEQCGKPHSKMAKTSLLKCGRKQVLKKSEEDLTTNGSMGLPLSLKNTNLHYHRRNKNVNQIEDREMMTVKQIGEKTSYDYQSRDAGKKTKYLGKLQQSAVEDQMNSAEDQSQNMLMKGVKVDWSEGSQTLLRHKKTQEPFSINQQVEFDDFGSQKWKTEQEYKFGNSYVRTNQKGKSGVTFPLTRNGLFFPSNYQSKASQVEISRKSMQNGEMDMEGITSVNMLTQSEETESDSSEEVDREEEISPMRSKLGYPSGAREMHQMASFGSMLNPKKSKKLGRKDNNDYAQALDRIAFSSKKLGDLGEQLHMTDFGIYSSAGKQKVKMNDPSYAKDYSTVIQQGNNFSSSKVADDNRKQTKKYTKNGHKQGEPGEKPHLSTSTTEKKQKGKVDHDYSAPHSSYMHDYLSEDDDDLLATPSLVDDYTPINRSGKKGQDNEAHVIDPHDKPNIVAKKRKVKVNMTYEDGLEGSLYRHFSPHQHVDDSSFSRKRGKNSLAMMTSGPLGSGIEVADVELETKPVKKPFTLITPTVHTGFSFSIIHLLSAVRMALITPLTDDALEIGKHLEKSDEIQKTKRVEMHGVSGASSSRYPENMEVDVSEHLGQKNLPSLTIQEIVNRVRSNPGDPCILETEEPLQDLVRGVLKVLSSKTAPLGAKGWKPLACYEKSTKGWSWIGAVSSTLDLETVEEETSSEAWGLPHKMLVKLVDSFANWLKSGQETLQLIGRLPAPPVTLMQLNLDEKERFRDLRAQKSLTTINPSSDEVKAYFRKEEVLRYSVPDRAFSYTAADGRKSIVAPLRRCGGKPTSKARDHFMLKPDRPPHVTVLCLVRDAAARLPGSIGTRADVCTLIRDSQYIVEDVSDAQINQVVSGALDRLHYERDPCVQFDGDRKLWVYLHREREEEDFEDDGTASTKKWKRQRKDVTEQSDLGAVNAAYHGTGDQITGGSAVDLSVEASPTNAGGRMELLDKDLETNAETVESLIGLAQGSLRSGHQGGWEEGLGYPHRDSKITCQENSTNEDFDDDTFGRERPVGLVTSSLL